MSGLCVAVIGPDQRCQDQASRNLAQSRYVVKQIPYYPAPSQATTFTALGLNVFILDLDSDTEMALKLIEGFSQSANAVVMAISNNPSTELVLRCMRAGAREVLSLPLEQDQLDEAMIRVQSHITALLAESLGRQYVFIGAKGGSGTTTIASNFALAKALASEKRVLLIDFDLPLGDALLNFGIQSQFSTVDALVSHYRLDAALLEHFITRHESGLFLLPAPGKYVGFEMTREAIDRLVLLARQEFDSVVIDAGTRFDLANTAIFGADAEIYLVSQTSVADLRNSNRILAQFVSGSESRNVQVVLNRDSSVGSFDEKQVTDALARSVQWRVPNDFKAVRDMQSTGRPIAMKDSPITRAILQMAQAGLNLPAQPEKKRKKVLGLF